MIALSTRAKFFARVPGEYCYHKSRVMSPFWAGRVWLVFHWTILLSASLFIIIYNICHPWHSYYSWVFHAHRLLFYHVHVGHQGVLFGPEKKRVQKKSLPLIWTTLLTHFRKLYGIGNRLRPQVHNVEAFLLTLIPSTCYHVYVSGRVFALIRKGLAGLGLRNTRSDILQG